MSFRIILLILPVLLGIVYSEFPLDFEETFVRNDNDPTIYRVPEDIDPIHFDVEITPYFEDEGDKPAWSFDGVVTLTFRPTVDNLAAVILQENVREISELTIVDINNVVMDLNATNPFERIREYHFLKINLRDGVTLGRGLIYYIKINYVGNINETPLSRGVFRGSYKDEGGNRHWYLATHLQPVNSRQAFPCLDEPGFKSTFNIIINRPAHFTQSFSNMKIAQEIENGNRVKEIFQTTPIMPAYLVSFHISEDFRAIADNGDEQRSYRILARPNAEGQGEYALEVGPPLTRWLEDYFGIEYYTMADDIKNDQIAVPDWASGATENWGLVSYRELRLLFEDGETNAVDKMNVATITAHELAHKWFGNLITCRWWDNVWINEGYASYFEYFAMDGVDPSMELEDQFNIMYVQSALSTDSAVNTRALQHTVNSPADVTGHFSGISYSKGASLLLMLKHFLTEDTFKKALYLFLEERKYQEAYPEHVYQGFAEAVEEDGVWSDVNITAFMQYWVDEPGYPVLNVNVDMDTGLISLEQERFFISATASQTDQVWPLPLTYTSGNNPNWNNLNPVKVMEEETDTIQKDAGHEWVIFNIQQKNIYRVNYDTHNWEMIASALLENPSQIHHLNRAQIVDDVFALMRSERITYNLGFKVLEFLKHETSYFVWYPAITGFSWLRNRFLHLPDTLAEFNEILYEFLDTVVNDLSYDVDPTEPLTRTLNRFFIMDFACNIGHPGCINDAMEKYTAYRTEGASVDPNIRRHVFCTGLRQGDYDDWLDMYNRRQNSNNQAAEVALLRAMGCTTNEAAVQRYLEVVLSDDVRAQDRVNAFTFLYIGDRGNAKVALQFLKENVDEIRRSVVLQSWFENIISNMASYMDEEGLNDMEEWLQDNQDTIPEYSVGISSINSARTNMQWGTDRSRDIVRAARGSANVIAPTGTLLFVALVTYYV